MPCTMYQLFGLISVGDGKWFVIFRFTQMIVTENQSMTSQLLTAEL